MSVVEAVGQNIGAFICLYYYSQCYSLGSLNRNDFSQNSTRLYRLQNICSKYWLFDFLVDASFSRELIPVSYCNSSRESTNICIPMLPLLGCLHIRH